jgi:RNA polymerase sigma-70 factor (ECF subfamily)
MNGIVSIFSRTRGDKLESILSPHINDLYSQAYRYLGDKHSAEDLVQDLLLYVCKRKETLLTLDPVKPWLMQCLYHRFVDSHRKRKRQVKEVPLDNEDFYLESTETSLEHQYMREKVIEDMAKLTPEQRAVITLFDIEGYSLEQVAQTLQMAKGTVKSHLHRGRKRLKSLFNLQPNRENERLGTYKGKYTRE